MTDSTPRRTKFYLDKQNAKWMGVCAGIADYTGVDVTLVRLGMILLLFLGSAESYAGRLPQSREYYLQARGSPKGPATSLSACGRYSFSELGR